MRNKKNKIKDSIFIYILLIMFLLVAVLGGLSKNIKDFFNIIVDKSIIKKDYKIIIEDDVINSRIKELEKDNKELRNLIELNKKGDYECINASVLYRNPSFWYDEITINKGLKHGIKNNSMVLTSTGLIGIINSTLNNSSTVSLLTNTNKKSKITVGIVMKDSTIYGLIDRYDHIKNEIIISDVTSDITYEKDLKVVTTNFTNTFKNGILIGTVKDIRKNKDGLSKSVIVTPSVNFNNIKHVCVVKG